MTALTGDGSHVFGASAIVLLEDTSCIIIVLVSLDDCFQPWSYIHNCVIVTSKTRNSDEICYIDPIANLLQETTVEIYRHHAIVDDEMSSYEDLVDARAPVKLNGIKNHGK
ncbi:hypothetical protein Ccrd_025423 [Cynara cardunculus var. scolymus]|uniref:Uncharacterized protein n=1 Tax=Cynara cardunculus var. scolymus TaxID=59895 RepID=A0A118JQW1_CYNCS|nr:hypothetical protein Ccrd_025423 [Cynara cardunculus var. scolymus]